MLTDLHVKNLALIDESEVELSGGLNILTGETGAGKSIIIDSVSFALGEKVPKGFLREGSDEGFVELRFSGISPELKSFLDSKDIFPESDEIVLSRRLHAGRTVAKINGESVNAALLKEVAGYLIDIHGQHEHQSLLNKSKHLDFLDDYAGDKALSLREDVEKEFAEYRHLSAKLAEEDIDESAIARERDLLSYEVGEIEDAAIIPGEDTGLEEEYSRMKNFSRISSCLNEVMRFMSDDGGAKDMTGRALKEIASASGLDKEVSDIESELFDIESLCGDLLRHINDYIDESEFDSERFDETERRLDLINRLKSKYGGSLDSIERQLEQKRKRLEELSDHDAFIANLKSELDRLEVELNKECEKLSKLRKKAAADMEKKLITELSELNFPDVRFEIKFDKTERFTSKGTDDICFMISLNPGEPLKELSAVASGGELSRIMLAIKSLKADAGDIETLIFDEIDTGISGETARRVAVKMHEMAKNHQIICITHLPQIASCADNHYLIEKITDKSNTISTIRLLDHDGSIHELARMIGGAEVTDTLLNSAREMKDNVC